MATVARRPLAPRAFPVQLPVGVSPLRTTKATHVMATIKRPRSPDVFDAPTRTGVSTNKRPKCVTATPEQERKDREKRKAERDAQKEEFRVKYTRAFPSWTFYFDTPDSEKERLAARVEQLDAHVAKFFSNEVTHFVTNHPIPAMDTDSNKENAPKAKTTAAGAHTLRSPIKLKGRALEDGCSTGYDSLVKKAAQLNMKIWDTAKLDSVLNRCLLPELAPAPPVKPPTRSLTSLLESERRHGTTERDPTQKRHDYHYFSKNSYFVLVEDMRQELATIAVMEYPISRSSDGREKGEWPVLYCHPRSRGPFLEYNAKEERRREKQERAEKEHEQERLMEMKKSRMRQLQRRAPDLRRSVSMNNLHRQTHPLDRDGDAGDDCDFSASANPSGYLASTGMSNYVAASGNSVGITSTYGTTSTAGAGSSRQVSQSQLPAMLRGRLQNQVLTSRKVSATDSKASASSAMMPPPVGIPGKRPNALLRKSKSTNTLRLPKRDEGSKPGYCESCRMKFEDFKQHIKGRKHRKFATNEANFLQLDYVLDRVRRRTVAEVEEEDACFARGDDNFEEDEQEQEAAVVASFIYSDDDDMQP